MTSEFPANKNNKICFTNACQCNDFVAVHLIKKTLKWSSFFCSYWWDTMGNKTRLSDIARFDDVYFTFNKLPRAKQFCQLSRQFYNTKAKQNWTTNIFRSICLFVWFSAYWLVSTYLLVFFHKHKSSIQRPKGPKTFHVPSRTDSSRIYERSEDYYNMIQIPPLSPQGLIISIRRLSLSMYYHLS